MELFTVSAAVFATLQISNSVYKLIAAIKDSDDPRVTMLQNDLLTQQITTKNWANRLRATENGELWAASIPPDSVADVERILEKLLEYKERAESKIKLILHAPDGKMTSRVWAQRFLFANGGFGEIKKLTDAMTSMNRALLTIAPPLPSYFSPPDMPTTTSQANRTTSQYTRSENEAIPGRENARNGEIVPNGETVRNDWNDPSILGIRNVPAVTLTELYLKCFELLGVFSQEAPEYPEAHDLQRRLRLFGYGVFEKPAMETGSWASIDALLKENEDGMALQEVLTRALVSIAVFEEQVLLNLIGQGGERKTRLENHRVDLMALLGSDALSETTMEIWLDLQFYKALSLSEIAEGPALPRLTIEHEHEHEIGGNEESEELEGSLENMEGEAPSTPVHKSHTTDWTNTTWISSSSLTDLQEATQKMAQIVNSSLENEIPEEGDSPGYPDLDPVEELSQVIEMLFDISPTIRTMRRVHLLNKETQGQSLKARLSIPVDSATETPISPVQSIEHRMDAQTKKCLTLASGIEEVLHNDETWAQKNGNNVNTYASIVGKNRERLEGFKRARHDDLDPAAVKTIEDTLSRLESALSKTLKDIEVRESDSLFSGPKKQIDVKLSGRETDKKIEELVELFDNSNNALWDWNRE